MNDATAMSSKLDARHGHLHEQENFGGSLRLVVSELSGHL